MPILANVIQDAFSPLISVFEEIMVFIHAHVVGGSWGLAIVGLTVLIELTFLHVRDKLIRYGDLHTDRTVRQFLLDDRMPLLTGFEFGFLDRVCL